MHIEMHSKSIKSSACQRQPLFLVLFAFALALHFDGQFLMVFTCARDSPTRIPTPHTPTHTHAGTDEQSQAFYEHF